MAVRRNILANGAAAAYAKGVLALKAEHLGPVTSQLGIPGPNQPVSTYDLFVVWHHIAMMRFTPPTQGDRNAAHSGPAFLPWHRLMLLLFERQIQRVLGDPNFGLPYWDWSIDGDLPPAQQPSAPIWSAGVLGGSGSPIGSGPFQPPAFRVMIVSDAAGRLRQANRGLQRAVGIDEASLSTSAQVATALRQTRYDAAPFNRGSAQFRNRLEGWSPFGLHNRVHMFVGGDMEPASSPNDPAFFLNHCNVDRIWESWMARRGRAYLPDGAAPADLLGHRLNDSLYSLFTTQPITPADLLDIDTLVTYDVLL